MLNGSGSRVIILLFCKAAEINKMVNFSIKIRFLIRFVNDIFVTSENKPSARMRMYQ